MFLLRIEHFGGLLRGGSKSVHTIRSIQIAGKDILAFSRVSSKVYLLRMGHFGGLIRGSSKGVHAIRGYANVLMFLKI